MQKTVKKDLFFFGIPALAVFFLGLVVSGGDGYDGLVGTIWSLINVSDSGKVDPRRPPPRVVRLGEEGTAVGRSERLDVVTKGLLLRSFIRLRKPPALRKAGGFRCEPLKVAAWIVEFCVVRNEIPLVRFLVGHFRRIFSWNNVTAAPPGTQKWQSALSLHMGAPTDAIP